VRGFCFYGQIYVDWIEVPCGAARYHMYSSRGNTVASKDDFARVNGGGLTD